MSASVLH